MDFVLFEKWITSHGLPMGITLAVMYFLFKYFMNQMDKPDCGEALKGELQEIKNKIDKTHKEISECKQSLSNLKGLLSGIFFRNSGADND